MRAVFVTVLALVVGASAGMPFAAAQEDTGGRYRDLIGSAVAAFDARDFTSARALFEEAHRVNPSARTFRGIGMATFEMGDYAGAAPALEAALRDERNPLTSAQAVEVHDLLERCRRSAFVLQNDLGEGLTRLVIDGIEQDPRQRGIWLNPGEHRLDVEVEGYERFATTYRAAAGEQVALSSLWSAEPVEATPAIAAGGAEEEPPPSGGASPWRWVLVSGAGASAVVALGTGMGSQAIYDDLDRVCVDGVCPASYEDDGDRGARLRATSIAMWSLSGAAAAGALAAWLIERGHGDRAEPRARLGPGPGHAGLSVHGRF